MGKASSDRIDVLLAYRSPASRVHEMIMQANMLQEQGLIVATAETGYQGSSESGAFHDGVLRLVCPTTWYPGASSLSLRQRWSQHYVFSRFLNHTIQTRRPKVVIAFDIDSMAALTRYVRRKKSFIIFHFSELPDVREPEMSAVRKWKTRRAQRNSHFADLHVHPDPYRAAIYNVDTECQVEYLIVPNCPRLISEIKPSSFRQKIEDQLGRTCRIVLYIGGLHPTRGLLQVIESMPDWPPDAAFVCRGLLYPFFVSTMRSKAHEMGVSDRFLILQDDAYPSENAAICDIAAAEIGIDLRQPVSFNNQYAAFATNKLHQYMAAGIPVIANDGPGYRELVELLKTGFCVYMNSTRQIADTVNMLLEDEDLRKSMGANGRQLHRDYFNYEKQFAPVLEKILKITSGIDLV